MDWTGKTVAVTGGAGGIGRAVAMDFAKAGAHVAVADLDGEGAQDVGAQVGGLGWGVDLGREDEVYRFVNAVEKTLGPIDVYVSNAGVGVSDGPGWGAADAPTAAWDLCWRVNVMASVWAARAVVPGMLTRGGGTFVITASAGGFLHVVGDTAYSATKHAAVSFAEGLDIAHADEGLRVHCLCPEGVKTQMTRGLEHSVLAGSGFIAPEDASAALFKAMEAGEFRVFTHENTAEFALARVAQPDRWLGGMRAIRRDLVAAHGNPLGPLGVAKAKMKAAQ